MDGGWETYLIYFMLGVLPWLFVAIGGWLLWSAHTFMKKAVPTRGIVVNVKRKISSSSSENSSGPTTTYCPVFEFSTPDGDTRQAETFLYSTSYNFEIGSLHDILVDPAGGKARMPGFMIYGFGAIFAGIGLLFGIVGIFALGAM